MEFEHGLRCPYCHKVVTCPICGQLMPYISSVMDNGYLYCSSKCRDAKKEEMKAKNP